MILIWLSPDPLTDPCIMSLICIVPIRLLLLLICEYSFQIVYSVSYDWLLHLSSITLARVLIRYLEFRLYCSEVQTE